MNKVKAVVAFHSGYGHTRKQAESVAAGIAGAGGVGVQLINVADLNDHVWTALEEADAIVFGSPTYMGGVSADFKKFADASSKPWFGQKWKNKIAGGFTNSATMNGDKGSTIQYLITLSMQHGMIWVGTGLADDLHRVAVGPDAELFARGGAKGVGSTPDTRGTNGSNSVFSSVTSIGGGAGCSNMGSASGIGGANGGSGGGGGAAGDSGGARPDCCRQRGSGEETDGTSA